MPIYWYWETSQGNVLHVHIYVLCLSAVFIKNKLKKQKQTLKIINPKQIQKSIPYIGFIIPKTVPEYFSKIALNTCIKDFNLGFIQALHN